MNFKQATIHVLILSVIQRGALQTHCLQHWATYLPLHGHFHPERGQKQTFYGPLSHHTFSTQFLTDPCRFQCHTICDTLELTRTPTWQLRFSRYVRHQCFFNNGGRGRSLCSTTTGALYLRRKVFFILIQYLLHCGKVKSNYNH